MEELDRCLSLMDTVAATPGRLYIIMRYIDCYLRMTVILQNCYKLDRGLSLFEMLAHSVQMASNGKWTD